MKKSGTVVYRATPTFSKFTKKLPNPYSCARPKMPKKKSKNRVPKKFFDS
jgi:hypothetical protein